MTRKRLLIHAAVLLLLPIIVAGLHAGIGVAIALVAGMLAWRWLIVLTGLWMPERTPEVVLDSIAASHFVEKVRWCLDRAGINYEERQSGGTLGVFVTGRTVPRLRIRTGIVESVIGNSPEILRYMWGAYGENNAFLQPTSDRLEFEHRLDRYGRNLQVWVYYHLLANRELTLHAWGVNSPSVPGLHKFALKVLYPVLAALIRRAFAISQENYSRAVLRIEDLLSDIDTRLADGRASILGGDTINYTDIAFAALSGLWLQPAGYGGVKGQYVRIDRERMPAAMSADVRRWLEDFPSAARFVERLYREER